MSWSLCFTPFCLDWVHNTLAEIWGESPLFTKNSSWWSLFAPCWRNLVIAPLDSISWDCTSWTLSCLALPLRGSPTWHWRAQTLFTMRHSHVVIHHDDGWTKLIFTNLSSILTLHLVECIDWLRFYSWLLTCLVACIGCDWKGCTLSGEASDQSNGYKTLLPWTPWHGFWSSGLCMVHLDNSWMRS